MRRRIIGGSDYESPAVSESAMPLLRLVEAGDNEAVLSRLDTWRSSATAFPAAILEEALRQQNPVLVKRMLALPQFDVRSAAPLRVAVSTGNKTLVRMVLESGRFDPNVAFPLRTAVLQGSHELVSMLLEANGVRPNRGSPLFFAVERNDLRLVKLICCFTETSVNSLTPARGTTPLCQAVISGCDDIFCFLLSHPRIDVNKGFLMTPLQLAADLGKTHMVKVMLSRPSLDVNKTTSGNVFPTALHIALESGSTEIAKLLLSDRRTIIPQSAVDKWERESDLATMQIIIDATGVLPVGHLWTMRLLCMWVSVFCSFAVFIADFLFALKAGTSGRTTLAAFTIIGHLSAAVLAAVFVFRNVGATGHAVVRLVPGIPVMEIFCLVRVLMTWCGSSPDVQLRERAYYAFQSASVVTGLVEQALTLLLAAGLLTVPSLRIVSGVALGFHLISAAKTVVVYYLRIHGSKYRTQFLTSAGLSPTSGGGRRGVARGPYQSIAL